MIRMVRKKVRKMRKKNIRVMISINMKTLTRTENRRAIIHREKMMKITTKTDKNNKLKMKTKMNMMEQIIANLNMSRKLK